MNVNEFLYEQETLDNNSYTIPSVEIGESPPSQSIQDSSMGLDNLVVILVVYIFTVAILSFNFERLKTGTKKIFFLAKYSKIPCANCRFFNSNPYLKCAVHPSKAFSKQAFDCLDYQEK
jgi:hypothetical protein